MKYIPHLFSLIIVLCSCQSYREQPNLSGCYQMTIKKDTAILSLNHEGDSVSGSLSYHWFEKDNSDGTFRGAIIDDSLIVADYNFQSEGITSVRQIVFRIRKDTLLQGYGEQRVVNDTSLFRDVRLAVFDTKNPFVKGCQ